MSLIYQLSLMQQLATEPVSTFCLSNITVHLFAIFDVSCLCSLYNILNDGFLHEYLPFITVLVCYNFTFALGMEMP